MAQDRGAEQRSDEERQAVQQELRDRAAREDIYPTAGAPTEGLKALIPIFGEGITNALAEAVKSGQIRTASLELTNNGEPPQTLRVELHSPERGNTLHIKLEGDWTKKPEIPEGNPLIAGFDGKFYRRRHKDDLEPLAEEGQTLPPNAPLGVGMRGKKSIWHVRLDHSQFPKGGVVTRFLVPNDVLGIDVKKGETIICYVKKVE